MYCVEEQILQFVQAIDPLELENFFPCPRPLYATLTSDSLEPVPDFSLYQDQAKELDSLADKLNSGGSRRFPWG